MPVDTVGNASSSGNAFNGNVAAFRVVASAAGALTSVGINILTANAGHARTAIYTDVAGSAGTLLAESSSTLLVDNSWNDLPVTGVTIVASTAYWLAYQIDTVNTVVFFQSAGATDSFVTQAYLAFPSAPSWSTTSFGPTNLRMTYTTPPALPTIGLPSSNVVPVLTVVQW